ncbi:hypothetical protein SAMN04488238_1332 [Roseicitreum antarcticum]|uniref:Uncharacterized protein n=1 Tax=Roseicitreum antarcticum TaxID=564137 RepID=A0A1H3F970_9RHOB|nr:hypothetical protein SAMN04488238_1332 [Roseicitreum antarcticum]
MPPQGISVIDGGWLWAMEVGFGQSMGSVMNSVYLARSMRVSDTVTR